LNNSLYIYICWLLLYINNNNNNKFYFNVVLGQPGDYKLILKIVNYGKYY